MKTTTLVIVTVLLAGFAGSTFAQGHYHHYRGSDGVVLATQIVDLVKTAITPAVVVAEPAVYAEPVVYTAPAYAPVYTAPVYCAPPPPPRYRYYRHCPPPRHRGHHGHHRRCR